MKKLRKTFKNMVLTAAAVVGLTLVSGAAQAACWDLGAVAFPNECAMRAAQYGYPTSNVTWAWTYQYYRDFRGFGHWYPVRYLRCFGCTYY